MFYYVPTKKGYVKVCKVMFMNTFKVTDKKIRSIISSDKFADPSPEDTPFEDHTCINLDPDDILMDTDENFLGEASNDISSNAADETVDNPVVPDQLNPLIKIESESCSTNQHSDVNDDSTESCNEDDKLPPDDIDNDASVTANEQQPVVELDDNFLTEYFNRYHTNLGKPVPVIGKPRKVWIKHDASGPMLPPCSCIRKCYAIYPDEARRELYTRFTKLSFPSQKRFLFRHIRLYHPKKKCRVSRRQKTWFYYLPSKSGYIKVCRVMFMNTFNISDKKIRNLRIKQLAEHASDEDDQHGKHDSSNAKYGSPGIDNASNQNSADSYSECGNYYAEVAESAVEPLLSILGCSVEGSFNNVTPTVAELEKDFLDEYFHKYGSNVAGAKLRILGRHGHTFPAPKVLPSIACACHRKCHINFPDTIRQMILDRYAKLSVANRIHFLTSHVKKETPLHSVDEHSKRTLTCLYYLPRKSGQVRVCNIMFLNTFNIVENELHELIVREAGPSPDDDDPIEIKTESEVIKIENDSESEKSSDMIVGDYDYGQKDDHSNPLPEQLLAEARTCDKPALEVGNVEMCMPGTSRQIEPTSKEPRKMKNVAARFAKEHICSFPRITSHFCQAVNKTKYLSCFLDVTSMYIAYIKACTESSKEPVPSKVYNSILQKERTKDPALPSTCDVCQHEETLDLGEEDDTNFWYDDT